MKKIKVLQTPVRFYPYTGGVENHVYYLSKELLKLEYEVSVLCSNEPNDPRPSIEGVNIKRLNYPFKITNTNLMISLPWELIKADFDIVHTHMPTPWVADWSVIIAKLKGKKSLITIHADINKSSLFGKLITHLYLNTVFRLTLYLVDKIIVVNKDWEKTFNYTGHILKKYSNKIVSIPNGVDIEVFKPLHKKKRQNSILFVSILDSDHECKGLKYLLEAVKIIKEVVPSIKLDIIGEGNLKKSYVRLSQDLGIEKNVYFWGAIDQKNLSEFYNKASVFVLPSTEIEAFGIVIIEALACETPVIATNIIGLQDDIKASNCGLIVPKKDPRALSNAILKIVSNIDLVVEYGKNGRILVENKYTWDRVATLVNENYTKSNI